MAAFQGENMNIEQDQLSRDFKQTFASESGQNVLRHLKHTVVPIRIRDVLILLIQIRRTTILAPIPYIAIFNTRSK